MNLILFNEEEDEKTFLFQVSKDLQLQKEFNFFFADYEDEGGCDIFLNFGVPTVPCLILTDGNLKKKFVLDGEITEESILKFIKNFKENKLPKFLKSADRPENDIDLENFTENILVVVADSFHECVKKTEKEIIFAIYDESEISTKGLLPIIKKLSNFLAEKKIPITVAVMNQEENDVDEEFCGHIHAPSVSFIKSNKQFVPYTGKGRGSELIEFIKKNSEEKFEIEELKELFLQEEKMIDEEKKCSALISKVQNLLRYFENSEEISLSIKTLEDHLMKSKLEKSQKEYEKLENLTKNQFKKAQEMKEIDDKKSLKNVIEIKSIDDYNSILRNNEYVAILFTDKSEPFAEPASNLFSYFSEVYTKFKFLKIDVNENVEISLMNGVSMLPTFKFIKNEKKIEEVLGGSDGELKLLFEKYL